MARTAWHLCRGFPLHTSSSLRSLCLHKEPLHIAAMCVLYVSAAYIYALSSNTDREHTWAPSFLLLLNLKIKTSSFKLFQDFFVLFCFSFSAVKGMRKLNCLDVFLKPPSNIQALSSSSAGLCCGVSRLSFSQKVMDVSGHLFASS